MPNSKIKAVILGSTAAGKSTFIGGLGLLGNVDRNSGIQVHAKENADSKGLVYLKRLKSFLNNQEWPPPSHTTEVIELSVIYQGSVIEITLVDYPGKDFQEELSKLDSEKNPALFKAYQDADFLIILLDANIDLNIGNDGSTVLKNQALERQEAILQVIREKTFPKISTKLEQLNDLRKKNIPLNIALVITKKDQLPQIYNSNDAEILLKKEAGGFYQNILNLSSKVQVFALSAVGNTELVEVEGRKVLMPAKVLNPVGYEEIFGWIINVYKRASLRPILAYSAIVAILLIIFGYFQFQRKNEVQVILANENKSSLEKIEDLNRIFLVWPFEIDSDRNRLIDSIAEGFEKRTEALPGDGEALYQEIKEIEKIRLIYPRIQSRLDSSLEKANSKREDSFFENLKITYAGNESDFVKKANVFLREFPNGKYSKDVDVLKTKSMNVAMEKDKVYLHDFQITTSNTLLEKSKLIRAFLAKRKIQIDPDQTESMTRASQIAELLAGIGTTVSVEIGIEKTKGLKNNLKHLLDVNLDGTLIKRTKTSGDATEWIWDLENIKFPWKIGDSIQIQLWDGGFSSKKVTEAAKRLWWIVVPFPLPGGGVVLNELRDKIAAEVTLNERFSILDLTRELKMENKNGYEGEPIVKMKLKLDGKAILESDRDAFFVYFIRNAW